MSPDTMEKIVTFAKNNPFEIIDITGGAPELVPGIENFLQALAGLSPKLIFRSNLTAIHTKNKIFFHLLKEVNAEITASFASLNEIQAEALRGKNIFNESISSLQKMNALGYGIKGTGLILNLVSNPTGAFLPSSQEGLEKRFRETLKRKWDIKFNDLFTFANVPLGRFKKWLENSGNYNNYLDKLYHSFNPEALDGVMCKNLLSVSWDGYLYDCDFNLAADLYTGTQKTHITDADMNDLNGIKIGVGDHCYACTAGSGFT